MSPTLGVCVIGCGGRLEAHAAAIREAEGARLVAVFDIDEKRAHEAAAANQARPYTDLALMLVSEPIDLAVIATPPWVRVAIVRELVDADVPAILIEKPISLLPSEAREISALGADRLVAVNTQYQWMPHWQALWPRIEAGLLGDVHTIRCSTWANVLEQGPHTIDLSMNLALKAGLPPPTEVDAYGFGVDRYLHGERVPSNLQTTFTLGEARLTCTHGEFAPIVSGETDGSFPIQVEAIGTEGRVWVSLTQGWRVWTRDGGWETGTTSWETNDLEAQSAVVDEIGRHLRGDATRPFPTHVERAAGNQELLYQGIISCLTGEPRRVGDPIDESLLNDDALWDGLGQERAAD